MFPKLKAFLAAHFASFDQHTDAIFAEIEAEVAKIRSDLMAEIDSRLPAAAVPAVQPEPAPVAEPPSPAATEPAPSQAEPSVAEIGAGEAVIAG